MGMLDQEIMLADGQTVTNTGDTPTTNSYDTAAGSSAANAANYNGTGDMGLTGERLWFQMVARSAPTSGGAATVQGVIQNSADGVTWVDVAAGPVIPVANITAGYHLFRSQPPVLQNPGMLRYFRGVWRVGTAALTAGTFDAYVSLNIQRNIARNSGYSV